MLGNVEGEILNVRGMKYLLIRAEWLGTGSPQGTIGLRVGAHPARLSNIGDIALTSGFVGAQPSGVASAGYLMFEMPNGAAFAQGFYTRAGGGTANTSLLIEITGN